MDEEIWKPVTKLMRLDNAYNVSSIIHIRSGYEVSSSGNLKYKDKIRKNKPETSGYIQDYLFGVDGKQYRFKRHNIVLQTFEPRGYKNGFTVDHKNRNKADNSLKNLRWASFSTQCKNRENRKYKFKEVVCLNDMKVFESCQEAEDYYDLTRNTVSRVARGERKSIHGFRFLYTAIFMKGDDVT